MTNDGLYPADDDLLQALVLREVDEHAEFVRQRFAARPELAAQWRELAATLGDVEDLRAVHEILAEESESAPRIDASAAVAAYRSQQTSGPRRWTWLLATVAAAGIMLALFMKWPTEASHDPRLGPGAAYGMNPDEDALAPGAPFRWNRTGGAQSYTLEIEDRNSGAPKAPAVSLSEPEWLPSAPEYQSLPERFRWRVIGYDGSGEAVMTSPWAESSRQ